MGAEPADLFFAKERAGAQLQVRIDRTRGQPHFERDRRNSGHRYSRLGETNS